RAGPARKREAARSNYRRWRPPDRSSADPPFGELELRRGWAVPVAEAAHGLDRHALRLRWIELTAQVAHVELHLVARDAVRIAPHELDELLPAERLDHVVVGARAEGPDLLDLGGRSGQHHHGHTAHVTDALQRPPAVQLRHRHIEDDEIGPGLEDLPQRGLPVRRVDDL